jgi:diguanylate cyclase (GGDEF)-like protein
MENQETQESGAVFDTSIFALSALDALGFGVTVISADSRRIIYGNRKLLEMSHYAPEQLIGQPCRLLCPSGDGQCPVSDLGRRIDNEERLMILSDKQEMPVVKTVIPLRIEGRNYLIESVVDNTERKMLVEELNRINESLSAEMRNTQEARREVEFMAYHDGLTGLPNKMMLNGYLQKAIYAATRTGKLIAVMFMDLDNFKMINDTMGHSAGDQILQQVAGRLLSLLRSCDTVARIGGDEFIIMLDDMNDVSSIEKVANKVITSFSKPFYSKEESIFITTSIGIAVFPEDGDDVDKLIKNSDIAMYKAKERGKSQWAFCTSHMKSKAVETMWLGNQLFRALDNGELELYYQPLVHCGTSEIIGMEALIRWNHPSMGLVLPDKFIHIAEHTGLIHTIGEWVIRTACRQNADWQSRYKLNIHVAVNLSARQLQNTSIVKTVSSILRETGLNPRYLEFEITESIAFNDTESVIEILNAFRRKGISIAIDDFGTEYSSLNYLKQLPVDRIKIAMPFVHGIDNNEKDEAITKAILVLAKSMGLKVVAEGVETQKQFQFLSQRMCDDVQGFFFFRPMPARDMEKLLSAAQERKLS